MTPATRGDRCANRAQESPQKHGRNAMAPKEQPGAGDSGTMILQRPAPIDGRTDGAAKKIGCPVAEHGARNGPEQNRPRIEYARRDEPADRDHQRDGRDEHADHGERFQKDQKPDHGSRDRGMLRDPRQDVRDRRHSLRESAGVPV